MCLLGLQIGTFSLIEKIITFSPLYDTKVEEIADDLQQFISNNDLTSKDEVEIAYWNMEHYNYWITLYDNKDTYYSTKNLWYDLNEIEKMGESDDYTIVFSDQVVQLMIYPLISPGFVLMLKTICLVSAGIIFLFMFLVFLSRKISYILTISDGVERMKHGELMHEIQLVGRDELTLLAQNINEMSDTLALQLEREKELKSKQMKMIASLSHDLRTPLTMVMSYLEFIKDGMYEDESKRLEYEQLVYQKATQIKELIEQLFDEVKTTEKERTNVQIMEEADLVLEQATHDLVAALNEEGFSTTVDLMIGSSFSMFMESHDFYRLIDNVYSNLLKYAERETPIQIVLKECESEVVLSVINKIKREMALEESYGIGLQSCEEIVTRSGGRLDVHQTMNSFSVSFYLRIVKKS
ncbi:MAG: HAMP domain-containing sensor histidine kinase [Turicibacter sp.]|nr:HAMP domain-containing sensor histidine kinase [Turicibacter sp.]